MDKKQCEICGTTLSSYNKGKRCFTHTEGNAVIERTPVTLCTSYDRNRYDKDLAEENLIPQPGSVSFDDMAFEKQVIGIVNKDGNLDLFDEPLTLDDIEEEE
jgi:hypothetical protein